jgi:hypothetical protein
VASCGAWRGKPSITAFDLGLYEAGSDSSIAGHRHQAFPLIAAEAPLINTGHGVVDLI